VLFEKLHIVSRNGVQNPHCSSSNIRVAGYSAMMQLHQITKFGTRRWLVNEQVVQIRRRMFYMQIRIVLFKSQISSLQSLSPRYGRLHKTTNERSVPPRTGREANAVISYFKSNQIY